MLRTPHAVFTLSASLLAKMDELCGRLHQANARLEAIHLFREIDLDNSGSIDQDEMRTAMQHFGFKLHEV